MTCQNTEIIVFDVIHLKPGVQYQEGNILGFSEAQPKKSGRTNLAIIIAPLVGGLPFVLLLILISLFTQSFLHEQSM